jgi:hypothetical protein
MKIRDLFRNPIERRIEEVIKVDLADEETVAYEISEYVVTDHIRQELEKVLDTYQDTITRPAETTNLWISGFFGSGKSSFAKVLGYLLENPTIEGKPAADRFFERVDDDRLRALLATIHAKAPALAVFVDLSSGRNVMREGESIVLPLYRALLERLDYARDITLAELEYQLEGDGDLEAFEEAFSQVAGERGGWRERRNIALARNEASHALHLLRPETFPNPDSWARSVAQPVVDANWFVVRALELLGRRRPQASRLVLVVDEVGQYVARSAERMFDLMGIAHAVQKQRGRVLLAVTSQEKLEDIVDSLEGRQIELARVRDRFPLTVDLVPSDIEEVVARRVLDKRAEGAEVVRQAFRAHRNQVLANTRLDSPARHREYSEEEFVRLYPILPYQVQLFIDAVSVHRARGGAMSMLGGSNRTLIKLAQQLVVDPRTELAAREVGALATAAMAYDLLEAILPTSWRAEVEQVASHHPAGLELPVAKTVALLAGVRGVKLDARNIAALLHPALDAESLENGVAEALRRLTEEEVLRPTDEGYKLQSPEEKDWERERRQIDMKPAQWAAIRRQVLGDLFQGLTVEQGRTFRVELRVDHDRILEGELSCVIEEREESSFEELRERSREETETLFWAYEASGETLDTARELHRSREMLKRREGGPGSGQEATLLGEERARLERAERRLRDLVAADLLGGTFFFDGLDEEPQGADVRSALRAALTTRVSEIFPRLGEFAAPARAEDALRLLREDTLEGLPAYLGEDGIGILRATPEGTELAHDQEPLATVRRLIEERSAYGSETTGRYLEEQLARSPCGASVDVVRVLLAALLRAGVVEVIHQGARIANPRDPRLEKVFNNLPAFRSATFAPQREVDPDMRARVGKRIQDLTGERPAIATDQLAAAVRRTFGPTRGAIASVAAGLRALGLGVPDLLGRAAEMIEGMERAPDDEVIKTADEAWADLAEARAAAAKLQESLDDEALRLLREACEAVRRETGRLGTDADAGIERLRDLLADPLRLPENLGAIRTLTKEHRDAWTRTWQEAAEGLRGAVHEGLTALRIRFAGRLEPAVLEEALRPVAILAPAEAADPTSGPPIEVVQARRESLDSLLDRVAATLEELASQVEVVRVRVRDLYEGVVSSKEELDALLERIRQAGDEALAQGKRFLLS